MDIAAAPAAFVERFEAKILYEPNTGHWYWLGNLTGAGYPSLYGGSRAGMPVNVLAYRWAWERDHGPIPPGYDIDHLCGERRCVNPQHLQAVPRRITRGRAQRERPACPHGHAYTPQNTYVHPRKGNRTCRQCHALNSRRRRRKE